MARESSRKAASKSSAGRRYGEMRDFARTPEPDFESGPSRKTGKPIFVVQKHDASRLHWDFRLEHGGVLWSWAVPKGPSMDPAHKRLAMHVEDHPVSYAGFEGTIPEGNYGAGTVETWDRGTWAPVAEDPEAALAAGELKFTLDGERLKGGFVLVRLKPRPREKGESWLLIKERDALERPEADAAALEKTPLERPKKRPGARSRNPKTGNAALPDTQAPQLAKLVKTAPTGPGWISEIKFDGYRMLCRKEGDSVRIITRNGLDWTDRLPALAESLSALPAQTLMLDGELVALDKDGRSSFSRLQAALSAGKTGPLVFYAFDLLHRDGTDLRPLPLRERRAALESLLPESRRLRFSEHFDQAASRVRKEACAIGLEGIVCKKADSPYRAGRGDDWVKVKCENREEFVVIGYTPPNGSRHGLGALQLGFHDRDGALHFAGGCGTGFSGRVLSDLATRLKALASDQPRVLLGTETPPRNTIWVKPELVAEIRFAGFTGGGMLRQAAFLGLREDKPAAEVVREPPDAEAERRQLGSERSRTRIVVSKRNGRDRDTLDGQRLTHQDRPLWPEDETGAAITKRDLALYWQAVAKHASGEIVGRPLAFVRCPDGIAGEHFFQKHLGRGMPDTLQEGEANGAPFVAMPDEQGFVAAAQIAAIELHGWGAAGDDPLHADRLVFDLDPGEGVGAKEIVAAARDVRARLEKRGLAAFCRTSGGKGLHVVAPVRTDADWDTVRAWCRQFAEEMEQDAPSLYVSTTRKKDRKGRILVDWLRNGLGSTAVCSFSPRARPGAGVATPLHWRELKPDMRFDAHTIRTVPDRLKKQRADPWADFDKARRDLPAAKPAPKTRTRKHG
ncbi:DNA ligase D [Acetobacteraceae bacterium KSS8]|uniref:DNA ligase (ATP) n=1 Tax=Endosaccharibacter trunci TaxID=2812733 RepID=A0ABT1W644_9PROT|nr:DNA ligase D [Acetobacteraceae bacterium KSS8]